MGRKRPHKPWGSRAWGAGLLLVFALVASAFLLSLLSRVPNHPVLGFIALLPLLKAVQVLRPVRAAGAAGLWGGAFWLFSRAGVEPTVAAAWVAPIMLVGVPALYAACGSWVTRRVGFSPFLLAVGWILVECSLQPLAPRHGLVAGAQAPGVLAQVGGTLGYAWVAFLVLYLGAWLMQLLSRLRLALLRMQPHLGLDDAGRWLWHVVPARYLRFATADSHPRAPPVPG